MLASPLLSLVGICYSEFYVTAEVCTHTGQRLCDEAWGASAGDMGLCPQLNA